MKKVFLSGLLLFTAAVFAEEIHDAVSFDSAVMEGDYSGLEKILRDNPKSVNLVSSANSMSPFSTPLDIAVWNGRPKLVTFLIEHGANVNMHEPQHGNTPLHLAVDINDLNIAKLLIKNGADVNAKNNNGNTPLMDADNGSDMQAYLEGFAIGLANFLRNPLIKPSKEVLENIYNGLLFEQNQAYLLEIGKKYSAVSRLSDFKNLFKDLYEQDKNSERKAIYKKIIQQLDLSGQKKNFSNIKFKFADAK